MRIVLMQCALKRYVYFQMKGIAKLNYFLLQLLLALEAALLIVPPITSCHTRGTLLQLAQWCGNPALPATCTY